MEDIKANQERMLAKQEAHLERMEVLLGLRPWLKVTKAETEAAVVTFEETSDKVECHEFGDNSKKD
jgi:hypothetical protein